MKMFFSCKYLFDLSYKKMARFTEFVQTDTFQKISQDRHVSEFSIYIAKHIFFCYNLKHVYFQHKIETAGFLNNFVKTINSLFELSLLLKNRRRKTFYCI